MKDKSPWWETLLKVFAIFGIASNINPQDLFEYVNLIFSISLLITMSFISYKRKKKDKLLESGKTAPSTS